MDTLTMDTLAFTDQCGTQYEVPVVVALDAGGAPQELSGDWSPIFCKHEGATWSQQVALHCARCGAPMFLPPAHLAFLPADTIEEMSRLWSLAGWPSWSSGHWWADEQWTIVPHLLFAALGGLPVRNDRLAAFMAPAD